MPPGKLYGFCLCFLLLLLNNAFAQQPKLMLPFGHTGKIRSAEFSADGKQIVTASDDKTAKIWDAVGGKLIANLKGHYGDAISAKFSPDGKQIITVFHGNVAKIWDANTGNLVADLKGDSVSLDYAMFTKNGKKIITIYRENTSKIWDASSGKLLAVLKTNSGDADYSMFSPNGKKIAPSPNDHHTKTSNASSGYLPNYLKMQSGHVYAEFCPDGEKIWTLENSRILKIWEQSSGRLLLNINNQSTDIMYLKFSPNGKKIVAILRDNTCKVWDTFTGRQLGNLLKQSGEVNYVEFSQNGERIVTASADGTAQTWDVSSGKLLADLKGNLKEIYFSPFSPDGKKIVTVLDDGSCKIWDASSGQPLSDLNTQSGKTYSAKFSPDGKKIVTSSEDNITKIWNVSSGKLLGILKGHSDNITFRFVGLFYPKDEDVHSFPFSFDGNKFITISTNNTCKVWETFTGRLLTDLKGHPNNIAFADFSKDGNKIWTHSGDFAIKIWDASSGNLLTSLKNSSNKDFYQYVRFSPDGEKIVTVSYDSTAKIWDALTGNLLAVLKGHAGMIDFARFSPDGKIIITNSNDGIVKIWDVSSGDLLQNLQLHAGRNRDFTNFSPDGKKIVTYSLDSIAKIWETSSGKLLAELNVHSREIHAIFSPDGKQIMTSSKSGGVNIWDASNYNSLAHLKGGYGWFSSDGKKIFTGDGDTVKIWNDSTFQLLTDVSKYFTTGRWVLTPDGEKIIAWSDSAVAIHTASSGKLLADFKGHPDDFKYAQFSPDGKRIVTISFEDHNIKTWDGQTGELLYTFFAADSTDYLVVDKFNRYDGTEAARKLLYFTCGTEVIEFDQAKDQLWVPNLAERIMKGDSINAKTLNELNLCGLTPEVEDVSSKAIEYHFKINPRRGGLGETILSINGTPTKTYKPEQLKKNGDVYELIIRKDELGIYFIAGKENLVTVKAYTSDNAISSRGLKITEDKTREATSPPNLYAVMVGISDYKGDELDLKFAAKDATDISAAVSNAAKKMLNTDGREHVFMYNLTTAKEHYQLPEKNSIKKTLEEIGKKATANDILLIFFAGHGVMSARAGTDGEGNKKQFYFLTADASKASATSAVADVGISTAELTEWMKPQNIKAQKRILIFDACNSGQAIKDFVKLGKQDQGYLAARNDDKAQQIKAIDKLNEKSGLFILSASASNQSAYEMGRYSQGLLTYSLLKAIKQQPDILEDGKYLNLSRWFDAAEKTVSELSKENGARQEPQIVTNTNFNIGVVDEEVMAKIVLPQEKPLFAASNFQNSDEAADGDNLELSKSINLQLNEVSSRGTDSKIVYVMATNSPDAFTLSGRYDVKGDEVTIRVSIKKSNETKYRFEVNGRKENIKGIAELLVQQVTDWIVKNK